MNSKRLLNELKRVQKIKPEGISIQPKDPKDLYKLIGTFNGLPDSPYQQGFYEVDLNIPKEYPINPPKAYFITKVWHPNISSVTGCICLDILSNKWALSHNLLSVMAGISSLLIQAEPNDPQDAIVAKQYLNDRDLFDKTAAFWNHFYAGGPRKDGFDEFESKISHLREMGYTTDASIHSLSMWNWDLDEAKKDLSNY